MFHNETLIKTTLELLVLDSKTEWDEILFSED